MFQIRVPGFPAPGFDDDADAALEEVVRTALLPIQLVPVLICFVILATAWRAAYAQHAAALRSRLRSGALRDEDPTKAEAEKKKTGRGAMRREASSRQALAC